MSIVSTMREQLLQTESQMKLLQDTHAAREHELLTELEALRASMDARVDSIESKESDAPADLLAQKEAQDKKIADLEAGLANWESKHQNALTLMESSEKQLMTTIAELEQQMSVAGVQKQDVDETVSSLQKEVDEHKAAVASSLARVTELEQLHASLLEQLDQMTKARDVSLTQVEEHKDMVARLEQQMAELENVVKAHQDGLNLLQTTHAKELGEIQSTAQADHEARVAELVAQHQETVATLEATLAEARDELTTIATQVAFALGLDVSTEKLQERISTLIADQQALAQEQKRSGEMEASIVELSAINDTVMKELETVKAELSALLLQTAEGEKLKIEHGTVSEQLAAVKKEMTDLETKNKKNSRLVEELEDQLASNFDQHQMTNNRLSTLQTERNAQLQEANATCARVQSELEAIKEEYAALQV
jgi:chromosome segregation ATPase